MHWLCFCISNRGDFTDLMDSCQRLAMEDSTFNEIKLNTVHTSRCSGVQRCARIHSHQSKPQRIRAETSETHTSIDILNTAEKDLWITNMTFMFISGDNKHVMRTKHRITETDKKYRFWYLFFIKLSVLQINSIITLHDNICIHHLRRL